MSLAADLEDLYDLAATRPTLFPSTTFFVTSCLHFFLPISLGADISGWRVHSLIPALEVGSYVCVPPVGLSSLHPAPMSLFPLPFNDSHYRPATLSLIESLSLEDIFERVSPWSFLLEHPNPPANFIRLLVIIGYSLRANLGILDP